MHIEGGGRRFSKIVDSTTFGGVLSSNLQLFRQNLNYLQFGPIFIVESTTF